MGVVTVERYEVSTSELRDLVEVYSERIADAIRTLPEGRRGRLIVVPKDVYILMDKELDFIGGTLDLRGSGISFRTPHGDIPFGLADFILGGFLLATEPRTAEAHSSVEMQAALGSACATKEQV